LEDGLKLRHRYDVVADQRARFLPASLGRGESVGPARVGRSVGRQPGGSDRVEASEVAVHGDCV
jgi:hypothetical protein